QDHGRIPMPVAAMLSGAVHQPLDLTLGEVAPLDCQLYDAWGAFLGCRFHADKLCLRVSYCIAYTHFLHRQHPRWRSQQRASSLALTLFRPRLRNDLLSSYSGDAGHPPIGGRIAPPVGDDFLVSNFHPGAIPGNLVRNDFWL